jgi:VWFA-related protein
MKASCTWCVLTGLFALLVVAVVGQAQVFRAETRLVVLHATVTDSHHQLVTGLDQRAFTVLENGKRQPITLFRRDDIPVSIGLLIDNSGSMRFLRQKVEAAALAFARVSNPQDEMFVLNFADKPRLDVPMTDDPRVLAAGIARVDSIGGTALRDAVEMAEGYLRDTARQDRRVLVVITDGNDNASVTTVHRIQQQAERTDTVINAIGLFTEPDSSRTAAGRRELDELTERTGGAAYFPTTVEQIESVAIDLAREIRNQYTIGYAPLNPALDGSYRTIRLTVGGPERYTIRTRAGYRSVVEGGP